jgi:hypothetical protein
MPAKMQMNRLWKESILLASPNSHRCCLFKQARRTQLVTLIVAGAKAAAWITVC